MSEPKHTPGPWEFDPQTGVVSASIAKPVAYIAGSVVQERSEANGYLSAAAPDMLSTLESVKNGVTFYKEQVWLDRMSTETLCQHLGELLFTVEAAIKKAKRE